MPTNCAFVVGCMRSGTTILQKAICSSPRVNPYITRCHYLTAQVELCAEMLGPSRLFLDDSFGDEEGFLGHTKALIEGILKETHRQLGQPDLLVLKDPDLSFFVPLLAGLLPDARFVLSVRDPRDTVASMIGVLERQQEAGLDTMLTSMGRDIPAMARLYNRSYQAITESLDDSSSGLQQRLHTLRYEDLVLRTDVTLTPLGRFLGVELPAHDPQGDWRSTDAPQRMARDNRWETYLTPISDAPLTPQNVGCFRQVLDDADVHNIDSICAELSQRFGYR